MLKKFK